MQLMPTTTADHNICQSFILLACFDRLNLARNFRYAPDEGGLLRMRWPLSKEKKRTNGKTTDWRMTIKFAASEPHNLIQNFDPLRVFLSLSYFLQRWKMKVLFPRPDRNSSTAWIRRIECLRSHSGRMVCKMTIPSPVQPQQPTTVPMCWAHPCELTRASFR